MSTLDTLIYGVRILAQLGQKLGVTSDVLNFASGATVAYNPVTGHMDVFINASSSGLSFVGTVNSNSSLVGGYRTGFNSSQFAAGLGPTLSLPPGAVDGTLVGVGDVNGAANTNPATIVAPDGVSVQNPQGPGFQLGDGIHLNQYQFDESGTWRYWMRLTDNTAGGRGAIWAAVW